MNVQPNSSERRQRVAELAAQQFPIPKIHKQLIAEGIVNAQTGKPFSLTTVRGDLALAAVSAPAARTPSADGRGLRRVSEMVGRVDYTYPWYRARTSRLLSIDKTQPDYVAWDKLRHGKLKGFEMSGLYCQPIVQLITAFEYAGGFSLTLEVEDEDTETDDPISDSVPVGELAVGAPAPVIAPTLPTPPAPTQEELDRAYTERMLTRLVKRILPQLIKTGEDAKALGDQYVVVNPDGSLSVPAPNTVKKDTDPLDYHKITRITITTVLDTATITDEYTDTARTVKIQWTAAPELQSSIAVFPNLIGRIPIIHFANDRSGNELFGRPIYEALFRVFSRIDDLLEKGIDGVELMGNPIPVFEGVEDVNAFLLANGVATNETYYDANGAQSQRVVLAMDKLPAIVLGKGAKASMLAPNRGMTEDIAAALDILFTLICVHTRIPVPLWGHFQKTAKTQGDPELPPFLQYILSRRLQLLGQSPDELLGDAPADGVYGLVDIWLRTKRLTDPRIVVSAVKATFPELTPEDAQTTLQKIIYANGAGLMRGETALDRLRLVSDPHKEVEDAKAEAQIQQANDYQTMINTVAHKQQDPALNQPIPKAANITSAQPPLPAGGRRARMANGQRVGEDAPAPTASTRKRRKQRQRENAPAAANARATKAA